MSGSTTLILGGGWGGLATAHHLRRDLAPEHRILVVERSDTFSMCVSYLWLMNGKRHSLTQVRREMARLKRPGIEWVQAEALSLDPIDRTVDTSGGRLTGDYVVLALGAELAPGAVAGFDAAAHNLYDGAEAVGLRAALGSCTGGRIVVLVAGTPFRCPAAPYEAAMLVEAELRERGIRDRTEMSFYTPEPRPMLVAGRAVSDALENMLSEKGIGYHPQHQVESIEPDTRTLHFADKTVPYDLLIGIPPHRPPALLAAAGLADDTGYVPVHPQTLEILSNLETLEVAYPGVYAIGDVTSIRLLNQLLLPKAGVFAEAQAQVVADAIASEIRGEPRSANFDGQGSCYVETGMDWRLTAAATSTPIPSHASSSRPPLPPRGGRRRSMSNCWMPGSSSRPRPPATGTRPAQHSARCLCSPSRPAPRMSETSGQGSEASGIQAYRPAAADAEIFKNVRLLTSTTTAPFDSTPYESVSKNDDAAFRAQWPFD